MYVASGQPSSRATQPYLLPWVESSSRTTVYGLQRFCGVKPCKVILPDCLISTTDARTGQD